MISMHTIVQNSLEVGLDADEFALAIAHRKRRAQVAEINQQLIGVIDHHIDRAPILSRRQHPKLMLPSDC
ncbi:hypothetical protein [Bradyrhizobium stylosanthis]|uniref:hypothetical protein n=1 Tax=Bradyrhizobium stylosanthis TaxID=1803665 RepID=UPI0007C47EE2|nr:hypothetical protein [Bradyrhizobium stylosanthis]